MAKKKITPIKPGGWKSENKQIDRLKKQIANLKFQSNVDILSLKKQLETCHDDIADYIKNQLEHHQAMKEKDAEIKSLKDERKAIYEQHAIDMKPLDDLRFAHRDLQKQFRQEMEIQETRLEAIVMMLEPICKFTTDEKTKTIMSYFSDVVANQVINVEQTIEGLK